MIEYFDDKMAPNNYSLRYPKDSLKLEIQKKHSGCCLLNTWPIKGIHTLNAIGLRKNYKNRLFATFLP
jgi:hypothetical protein